jgi:nicotinamide riboside kinase
MVRPYKIAVVGAESSGKSTLCEMLSQQVNGTLVSEFAREYLSATGGHYNESDLEHIANQQVLREINASKSSQFIICDSDVHNIRIWSEIKFGRCSLAILNHCASSTYDLAILTTPDLPWEKDVLREYPNIRDRQFLHKHYQADLVSREAAFTTVNGSTFQRRRQALSFISRHIPHLLSN